ncbi:DUF362 domain-containing protein [candidate division KSB1 bacterium]|nr:DUF362 domain-containing protein [candidate division KSB1 bacterium]
MNHITRRNFLRTISLGAYSLANLPLFLSPANTIANPDNSLLDLAVVKNGTPAQMVRKVVEMLGGMSKFVKKGQSVIVKPNIGWDRRPEQAANTNPEVVVEIIKLCQEAGASKVTVFDRSATVAQRAYKNSGIEAAAEKAGAKVRHVLENRFKSLPIPQGQAVKSWEFYKDILEADVFINVPIAKHHSLCKASLAMKNLMGVIGGDRGQLHNGFPEKITDINTILKPQLTILDAVRILTRNGPQGGSLDDVKSMNTIIAGTNTIAVDAFGATLFGLKPIELDFLRNANRRGLGEIDLGKLNIKEVII